MLSKNNRFSFKDNLPGNVFQSKSFTLRFGTNDLGKLRAAVVVSKRVDKRATVRNRIKRKILEAVRNNISMDKGLDIVFYARKQAAESSGSLDTEVKEVLTKII